MSRTDTLVPNKPAALYDRDEEWEALAAFSSDAGPGPSLAVVTGRFRQGKTYLLEAVTTALGGFYFCAQEASEADTFHRLREEMTRFTGSPTPELWRGWPDAVDALLDLGRSGPVPVVLDEFPLLVRQSPELPALMVRALGRREEGAPNRTRLILSGSPRPVMRRLFGAPSGLSRLASLSLEMSPLDYRQAAGLWGVTDPRLAVLVHSVVGGSPAYRFTYGADDTPRDEDDFDVWVCRTALDAGRPVFHEAEHLVRDEMDDGERDLCHSVLTAVSLGCTTAGDIAGRVGRSLVDVARCTGALWDRGLLAVDEDAFRPSVRHWRVTEPVLAFGHAITRQYRSALERRPALDVWHEVRPVFDSSVALPHFADLCREWALRFAAPETFGASVGVASRGSLPPLSEDASDAGADVVVSTAGDGEARSLLSVGLVHWNKPMDGRHLAQLHSVIARLAARGVDTARIVPACYGGAGFSEELRIAARQGEIVLVDPERIYSGH